MSRKVVDPSVFINIGQVDDKIDLSKVKNNPSKDHHIDDEVGITTSNPKQKLSSNPKDNDESMNKDENRSIHPQHITMMEISPKEECLITYNEDNQTIFG